MTQVIVQTVNMPKIEEQSLRFINEPIFSSNFIKTNLSNEVRLFLWFEQIDIISYFELETTSE